MIYIAKVPVCCNREKLSIYLYIYIYIYIEYVQDHTKKKQSTTLENSMFKIVRDSMLIARVNHDLSPTKLLLPAAIVDDVVKYFKQRSNIELEYMIFFF
jgi:hypothetical protein